MVKVVPLLKWAGGKRQLLPQMREFFPQRFTTYVDPFIGGGAVLFDIDPNNAIINDSNPELINLYTVVKNNPDSLISALTRHAQNHSKEYFYRIRALDKEPNFQQYSEIEKAARTIYLNKTCFNGLYRLNRSGQFNVSFGKYDNPKIVNKDEIFAMSEFFNNRNIDMRCGDFSKALYSLPKDSFVYFDPPYFPRSKTSSFTGYTKEGFTTEDQIRLSEECNKLNSEGIKFMLSNNDVPEMHELYKEYNIRTVKANRGINSDKGKRGKIQELLVTNY